MRDEDADTIQYQYDGEYLSEIIKPDEKSVRIQYEVSFDAGKRRALGTLDENGNTETFFYNKEKKETIYSNYAGVIEKIWYDDSHRTLREQIGDGKILRYEYDERGNTAAVYEKADEQATEENTLRHSYDDRINLVKTFYADKSQEDFLYNERD